MPSTTIRLRVGNNDQRALSVVLEPWGDACELPPRRDARGRGPDSGAPEIVWTDRCVTVFAWTGATGAAFANGTLVLDGSVTPPSPPGELSVRAWVELMNASIGRSKR